MNILLIVLLYVLIPLAVIGIGLLLYLRAFASRKHYVCAQCGERQSVELMEATDCNSCGAPFNTPSN